MPRKVRDSVLDTREARGKLRARGKPYWRTTGDQGLHLGYRRLKGRAGTWWARHYLGDQSYAIQSVGVADDLIDADGVNVLNYWQAQAKAREQRNGAADAQTGPYTVGRAMDDYLDYLRSEGRSEAAVKDASYRIDAFIRPTLGKFEVAALKAEQLRRWRADLANAAPRLRTGPKAEQQLRPTADDRARKASANRILTTLKAALNHAFDEEKVSSNKAWGRRVKPFENAGAARPGYLKIAEAKRLLNACDPDFRMIVQAALQTGARYGQIAQLKVGDFNPDVGTIDLRSLKGRGKEKTYSCVLGDEGKEFFKQVCAGRAADELIFRKRDGGPWLKSHQARPMREACRAAKIVPALGIHQLRHTWASHAVMNNTPLMVVAKNLGHADTRMVEKHYSHLAKDFIVEAIRAGAPKYGFTPDRKVVAL